MIQHVADKLLERKISKALAVFTRTRSRSDYKVFAELCKQRSPEQIARMERAKGLA